GLIYRNWYLGQRTLHGAVINGRLYMEVFIGQNQCLKNQHVFKTRAGEDVSSWKCGNLPKIEG
ncbi:MAG: hypothetical protein ACP5US_09700, partial [Candidatus Kryptoniota bacterium]